MASTKLCSAWERCFWVCVPHAFAQGNPLRDAYFGETHVHTSWSLDAWIFGNRLTDPGDAYKYFKGEPIKHPLGYDIKIDTPLDFAGVTDHSEYVGVVKLANDPSSPISKMPAAQPLILKNNSQEEVTRSTLYAIKLLARRAGQGTDESRGRPHGLGREHRIRRTRQTNPANSLRSAPMSGRPCPTT